MCKVEGCINKPWKEGFCYTKHRKLANSAQPIAAVEETVVAVEENVAAVEELVIAEVTDFVEEELAENNLFVCEDIVVVDSSSSQSKVMSPNKVVESALPLNDCVYVGDEKTEKQINCADLFDQIFDMETGGPCVENLKSVNEPFYEKFDHNKLAFIINNLDAIKDQYRPNARDSLSLDKYYEKSKAGNSGLGVLRVKYFQNGKDTIRGRYQAINSLSGQNMVREVRHTIFDEYYVDMDMDNCHPVITVWLCNKLSVPCGVMTDYVANREQRIQEVIAANPDQTRDTVKQLFLSINYGGSEKYKELKHKTPFVKAYMAESASIKKAICNHFKYFKAESDKSRLKQNKEYNLEGAAMSHVCCFVENQLLMIALEHLKSKMGDVSGSILCFDGIMIRKDKWKSLGHSVMNDIEQIFSGLGIPIKLSVKSMKPLDLVPFGFDPKEQYSYTSGATDTICLDAFEEYEVDEAALSEKLSEAKGNAKSAIVCNEILALLKLLPSELIRSDEKITSFDIVSQDIFTLKEIALLIKKVFAYIYNNGDYFIMTKATDTIHFKDGAVETIQYVNKGGESGHAFKKVQFAVSIADSLYSINLKSCLIQCAKGIMYRNVDVIPSSPLTVPPPSNAFNLFGKYQHQYDPNFVIDQPLVDLWVNHIREVLGSGVEAIGEYLLNWFAHVLQRPNEKTGTVPLIRGIPGCGKNLPFNVFQRYVLSPDLSLTCPDMDKLFSRFNTARMGKVLIVLDEAVDSCDRRMNNKMKNFITEERVQIEAKGKDLIEVSDFSNYVIITNNDFASIIEKNDRRYVCLVASDRRVGNREYFNHMVKSLLNVNAGRHIFHWLLRRDISGFEVRDIPSTTYKKELSARQTDNVVKWLLAMHEDLVDRGDDDEQHQLTKEWYGIYSGWCKEAGETKTLSLAVFTSIMNREGFAVKEMKMKEDGVRKTIRPRVISREILERNLSDYITLEVVPE